ncbi:MAG: hypothetical protein ACE5K1_08410 [Acidiferrobacterales bacterium]
MQQRFFQRLSGGVQQLVQELENFAGVEIDVRPAPVPSGETAANPKAVILAASEEGAALLYRNEDAFGPRLVLHELLHLQRYWIDCVPQLMPVSDPDGDKTRIANEIENTLEHLVIVPREAAYGFDPYSFYRESATKSWETYPWPDIKESWARRKTCFLNWLTATLLVKEDEITSLAERSLNQEGLYEEAKRFSDKIGEVVNSKERCISTVVRFLRIPRNEAALGYLDIRNKSFVKRPIPEH